MDFFHFVRNFYLGRPAAEENFLLSSVLRHRNETTKKTNRCEKRSDGSDFAENGAGKKKGGSAPFRATFYYVWTAGKRTKAPSW